MVPNPHLVAAAAGTLAGVLTNRALAGDRGATPAMAGALVVVAAVYPAARLGRGPGASREWLTVAGAGILAGAASRAPARSGRRFVGAGWLAHAGFDLLHGHRSALPEWYGPMCAAFDIVVAVPLLRDRHGR